MKIDLTQESQKETNQRYLELHFPDKVVTFPLFEIPHNNFMLKVHEDYYKLYETMDDWVIQNNELDPEDYLKYLENIWNNFSIKLCNSNDDRKTVSAIDVESSKNNVLTNSKCDLSNFISNYSMENQYEFKNEIKGKHKSLTRDQTSHIPRASDNIKIVDEEQAKLRRKSQSNYQLIDGDTSVETVGKRNANYSKKKKKNVAVDENIGIKNYSLDRQSNKREQYDSVTRQSNKREQYDSITRQRSHSHKILKKNAQEMIDKINLLLNANTTMLEKHNTLTQDDEEEYSHIRSKSHKSKPHKKSVAFDRFSNYLNLDSKNFYKNNVLNIESNSNFYINNVDNNNHFNINSLSKRSTDSDVIAKNYSNESYDFIDKKNYLSENINQYRGLDIENYSSHNSKNNYNSVDNDQKYLNTHNTDMEKPQELDRNMLVTDENKDKYANQKDKFNTYPYEEIPEISYSERSKVLDYNKFSSNPGSDNEFQNTVSDEGEKINADEELDQGEKTIIEGEEDCDSQNFKNPPYESNFKNEIVSEHMMKYANTGLNDPNNLSKSTKYHATLMDSEMTQKNQADSPDQKLVRLKLFDSKQELNDNLKSQDYCQDEDSPIRELPDLSSNRNRGTEFISNYYKSNEVVSIQDKLPEFKNDNSIYQMPSFRQSQIQSQSLSTRQSQILTYRKNIPIVNNNSNYNIPIDFTSMSNLQEKELLLKNSLIKPIDAFKIDSNEIPRQAVDPYVNNAMFKRVQSMDGKYLNKRFPQSKQRSASTSPDNKDKQPKTSIPRIRNKYLDHIPNSKSAHIKTGTNFESGSRLHTESNRLKPDYSPNNLTRNKTTENKFERRTVTKNTDSVFSYQETRYMQNSPKYLLSADISGNLIQWDISTLEVVKYWGQIHHGQVFFMRCQILEEQCYLITIGNDSLIRLWKVPYIYLTEVSKNETDESFDDSFQFVNEKELEGIDCTANIASVSPDGKCLFVSNEKKYLTSYYVKTLSVWKRYNNDTLESFFTSMCFTEDNEYQILGSSTGIQKKLKIVTNVFKTYDKAHDGAIESIEVSKDGMFFFTCGMDRNLKQWSTHECALLKNFGEIDATYAISHMKICLNNNYLMYGTVDGRVKKMDIITGHVVSDLGHLHSFTINSMLAFEDEGCLFTGGGDEHIIKQSIETNEIIATFGSEHNDWVSSLALF